MTQAIAQQIIEEASQDRRISAELDTKRARGATRNTGYRVKLTLKSKYRVLTIMDAQDWQPIREAWNEVLSIEDSEQVAA